MQRNRFAIPPHMQRHTGRSMLSCSFPTSPGRCAFERCLKSGSGYAFAKRRLRRRPDRSPRPTAGQAASTRARSNEATDVQHRHQDWTLAVPMRRWDTWQSKMPPIWSHTRIVLDIASMKVFVWVLRHLFTWAVDSNGGILDSHLFFYSRYSDLAHHYRLRGRSATANRLAALAEAYYQAAPDDDDDPRAAAMAVPVPRPLVRTNAVSTAAVPKPKRDEPAGRAPSLAH